MFEQHFYHGSMRKLVVAFGSLFNEIYISRKNADGTEDKKIKVPITYSPKEKFYRKVIELDLTEADPTKARQIAEDMARKLLANTVIESFRVEIV